ncbi:MAG: FAD-binding oxidoreductase, partial [Candidatus Asgardarchaeia archaeon]
MEVSTVPPKLGGEAPLRIDVKGRILTDYSNYLVDESRFGLAEAEVIFFPRCERDIAQFLVEMERKGAPVTISGGRTGIVGGAVPEGGGLLCLDRMDKVLGVRWDASVNGWSVKVQPGLSIENLRQLVEKKRIEGLEVEGNRGDLDRFLCDGLSYFYPPDPTEETASIGGTVATDASGARSYKYGSTRRYVKSLRVVLSCGEVIEVKRGLVKEEDGKFLVRTRSRGEVVVELPSYSMPQV